MAYINEHYLKLRGGYLFPEIARRIDAYVARNPQAKSHLIHCGIGDVTEPLPGAVVEAMKKAADELSRRETFRGYGPAAGYEFLRNAIADADYTARGMTVDPSEVFVSDGAKGDCGHVLEILGPGNRMAVADPVYPVYVDTNVMAGNTGPSRDDGGFEGILYLPGTPDNGFVPPPPDQAVDLAYLCFPNNPTGAVATHEQLEAWVRYALDHDTLILYDAAYEAFIGRDDVPRSIFEIKDARRCAIEFKSFSKSGGFTGVRCGYTICPKDVQGTTRAGERIGLHGLWMRRWSTRSNGVSYPVQRAAEALYSPKGRTQVAELIGRYRANAAALRAGCEAVGQRVWGGEHAPYVWVACPDGVSSWEMFDRLLQRANIVVVPGVGFGACGEGFFRISAFNTAANVKQAMQRFQEHAGDLFAAAQGAPARS